MTFNNDQIEAFAKRVDAVEQQNRRIVKQNRTLRMLVFALPAVALLVGAAANKTDVDAKTVTAEKLVIVDANGKPAIVIGVAQGKSEGRAIVVLDSKGTKRIELGLAHDKRDHGAAFFNLRGEDGKARIALVDRETGPRIQLIDEGYREPFVEMGLSNPKQIPFIEINDKTGKHMFGWGGNAYKN